MSTVSYKSFKLENLKLTTPIDNAQKPEMTKNMKLSLPQYLGKDGKSSMPQIQGPWMNLSTYGIPSKKDKNGNVIKNSAGIPLTDRERGRLKVPFDTSDPEQEKFYELMKSIDQKCIDESATLWGTKKKADFYSYVPLVREAQRKPEDPEDAPTKPDYFTMKFDFDWQSGGLKTLVYENKDGDRSQVTAETVDDVQRYVRYKSDFRPVFSICKLYASKSPKDGKYGFGFGLKLKHIEVKPSQTSAEEEQNNAFVEEDDEDEIVERRELVKETVSSKKEAAKAAPVDSEEDEEEEEEEAAPAPKTPAKSTKKVVAPPESEEEEETAPAPKTTARRGRGTRTTAV
jgi:hypothetical protein